jgi:hypothetical protein
VADDYQASGVAPDKAAENADGDAQAEAQDNEKILADAKTRFQLAEEAEHEIRAQALEDLKFAAGDQWDSQIVADRRTDGRPCLTINRIPQHIKQVTNDQRQNRPSIKVHPVDDQADVETAKVLSGLIRHIEYNSNADVAYDTAFESAVRAGRGYFRVLTDYVSPLSFEQEILIKRVRNPFSVFFDPFSSEPDGSDANFAFITEDLSREEYKRTYPDSKLAQSGEWESVGNNAPGWMGDKSCRVAEYFYRETRTATIVQLASGEVVEEKDLHALAEHAAMTQGVSPDLTIVDRRETEVPVIRWCKLNGIEILSKTDWLGSFIPIIPVIGEELDIDGQRVLKGIVRDAKDPQRMLNYWKSAETEAIALAPRAPYLVAAGQLEGFESQWETANRRNHAYLPYNVVDVNGTPVPPPQRQALEPAVQAITQAAMLAADDLKATTGIYDASLGNKSNETSGVAIQRRNNQAQTSNFHFVDNLTRSLRHAGRVIVEIIPKIYDTARTARIIGEDGTPKMVKLNQPTESEGGKPVVYELSAGKYDVTVDVGPSYASKRQEAVVSMMEVTRAVPQLMQIAGDLLIKNMDWPGAQEIADRLKKTLPPNLADDQKKQDIPPQVQAQMQQMGQMVDALTKQLHAAHDVLDQKKIELESKERIEFAKIQANVAIAELQAGSKEAIVLLNHQIGEIENRLQSALQFSQPIGMGGMQPQGAPMQQPGQQPNPQDFAPQSVGAPGADAGQGASDPTGGAAPGSPMEGNPPNVEPNGQ